ncbi:hypothetical protein C3V43_00520 [Bacteroides heparinolyticus]|nr:hypothetical protein C3V43_00520 [Bacteroides heparinolyticus]
MNLCTQLANTKPRTADKYSHGANKYLRTANRDPETTIMKIVPTIEVCKLTVWRKVLAGTDKKNKS